MQDILATYTVDEGRIVLQSVVIVIDSTTYYIRICGLYYLLLLSATWGCPPSVHAHEALKSYWILNILNNYIEYIEYACQDLFIINSVAMSLYGQSMIEQSFKTLFCEWKGFNQGFVHSDISLSGAKASTAEINDLYSVLLVTSLLSYSTMSRNSFWTQRLVIQWLCVMA